VIEDWHNLGPHYDKTLMAWNDKFHNAWPQLQGKYDTRFQTHVGVLPALCAGASAPGTIQVWQIVMTKYGTVHRNPAF